MQAYRARLRKSGLRPIQIWVPDTRTKHFAEEAKRQSLLVAAAPSEEESLTFLEALFEE